MVKASRGEATDAFHSIEAHLSAKTEKAMEELYIGELDEDNYLKITDRKKTLIKSEGGEYISLTHVEDTLSNSRFVDQVITFAGDDKPFVTALIVPDFNELKAFARSE